MSQVTVRRPGNGKNKLLPRIGSETLGDFARAIEAKLKQGYGPDAIANLVCRLMMSKDERIAALMTCKWAEWRYGKPKEQIEHSGPGGTPVQIINHVPRPGDRSGDDAPDARDGDVRMAMRYPLLTPTDELLR